MPYFPVDDQAAFHPKFVMAGNAAIGLWARAGSWAKNHATGGFVPTTIATSIGTKSEIKKLVTVGLWEEVLGGYLFHDWEQYGDNHTGAEEEARKAQRRASARDRQRRHRDRVTPQSVTESVTERDSHAVTEGVTLDPVPSPSPSWLATCDEPSVPETAQQPRTDPNGLSEIEYLERAMRLRVDFRKVRTRFVEQAGEPVPDETVWRCILGVVARGKDRGGDRTGLVIRSLQNDWAEWSRLVFQEAS